MARPRYPSDQGDRLMLRFPDGLRQRLAERAKANLRSMNSEVIKILTDVLGDPLKAATGVQFGDQAPAAVSHETALAGGPITHGL